MKSPGRGALIVFEGCDRTGKTTQARLLLERIEKTGAKGELICFPDRTTDLGKFLDQYLKGEVKLDAREAHLAFAANRQGAVGQMIKKLRDGYHIVTDRYTYSGIAYTLAKQAPGINLTWAKLQDVGILKPDCVVFFDLSPDEAGTRCGFGEEVLEALDLQHRAYDAMTKLGSENPDIWKIVDASLPVETLAHRIWEVVEPIMKSAASEPLRLIDTVPPSCPSL